MIPEIDVRTLLAKKIWEGTLSFSFVPEAELIEIPYTSFEGEAAVRLSYRICEDNSVDVEGEIRFTLAGDCSRCLRPARRQIAGNVSGCFFPGESDGENYGYRGGKIALGELLRDSVMFALPSRLLCDACAQWENEEKDE